MTRSVTVIRRVPWTTAALGVWTALVFVFLFAPVVTAFVYSFNEGVFGKQTASFVSFTTHWYSVAWNNEALRHSVEVSVKVATLTAIIATIIGTIAALAVARSPRIAGSVLELLIYLLLIVPEIVLGVGFLLFYTKLGVSLGTWPLVLAHTPYTIAVVMLVVRARVLAIDRATEDAAADLGAGRFRVFWTVTFPQLQTAVLAAAVLAFTFSFDDLIISVFLATPTVTTLPVYLFGSVRFGLTPDVYAVAAAMFVFTLVMLAVVALVYAWQARRFGTRRGLASEMANVQ